MDNYDFRIVEEGTLDFWKKQEIYKKVKEKNKKGKKYYFLDGPPYTSGRVHIGTAWNKALKDMILRYKRMQGFNVFDRAGYDMHGLPTAQKVMAEHNIKSKKDIPDFGVEKFMEECKKFSIDKMKIMNDDFSRIGVWMDFENAYMPITREYIDGEWWLIKKAHEKGRLYEGFRSLAWDYVDQTSLAKHELEYQTVTDLSIFVKFKVQNTKKEYLIIWTTTPWTIPFNLGIMVHPELEYVKLKVGEEVWILSKALGPTVVMSVCGKKYELLETFPGSKLEGLRFYHPFADQLKDHYDALKKSHPKVHTVVLSSEYVDLSAGTGLVHMAPGCGPEDYEIGYRNNIPAWNTLLEDGSFPEGMGEFSKKNAKEDNMYFRDALERRGVLIGENEVEHEYPFGQRSHAPVIFRATKQWFFKVEDIKEQMIKENNKIKWVPDAAYNAFNSWLNNLRDNSITKQLYWGTPVPIWRNIEDEKDIIVVGSVDELEKLSGKKITQLHKPWIDEIEIKQDGKTYKRIPDILDVWVDAGCATWNALDLKDNAKFEAADFILEGKDQIRGWFNLLHVAAMISVERPAFKACYMHGFVQDAQGRKMSKSLGNQVSPYEVIEKYGADTLRYYLISGANPAVDINYNFEDLKTKNKNLLVLWNLHRYLLDLIKTTGISPKELPKRLPLEEKYILSRLHSTIEKATQKLDSYLLNEIPIIIEELFLDLSRSYIQLIREKVSIGSKEEKQEVISCLGCVLLESLKMFSIVCPFITESVYHNLQKPLSQKEESIHFFDWPKADTKQIDTSLESNFAIIQVITQNTLYAREKATMGVRWPLPEVIIETIDKATIEALASLETLFLSQTNVKKVRVVEKLAGIKLKINGQMKTLGPEYGTHAKNIIDALGTADAHAVHKAIQKESKFVIEIGDNKFDIRKEHIDIEHIVPDNLIAVESKYGVIYLNKDLDPELEAEGFAREIMRRIQAARKKAGLQKTDQISLFVHVPKSLLKNMLKHEVLIKEKCGAKTIELTDAIFEKHFDMKATEKIKDKEFSFGFDNI